MLSRLVLTFLVCVSQFSLKNDAAPTTEQRMTVTKMSKEDLDSSATGYVYNQQQGLPVYYVQYTNHGSGRYYHEPDAVQYVVEAHAPVAHVVPKTTPLLFPYATTEDVLHQGIGNYGNEQSLKHVVAPVNVVPLAPYYAEGKITANEEGEEQEMYGEGVEVDHDEEDSEEDEGDEDEDHYENIGGNIHGGSGGSVEEYGGGYGDGGIGKLRGDGGSSFEASEGEKHAAEEYSEHGEKGKKGYEAEHKFSKGESGSDDNEHKEGYYENSGGNKKGHVDEAEEHGSHEEEEKNVEGSNYGQSSHHKKGEKTKGFHNVYHKDEYKKETDFYDDDHKKGHYAEYEESDKGYKDEEGGFKKGGHYASGHDYHSQGDKGRYDKGHHDSEDQGHDVEEGNKSYFSNHEDYGAEKGSKSAKSHKFSSEDR